MQDLRPFALERFFARHEFTAPWLLCSSDCETTTIGDLLALEPGAADRLAGLRLGYTETRGAPSLRRAIADLYGGLGEDDVFVHAGAEEAILNFCLAALSPGDRVVAPFPCYQSLAEIPRSLGCDVRAWTYREVPDGRVGTRWFLDPDDLPALAGERPRLIVLNQPHNPTGALMTRAEFDAVVAFARRTGALLLVDEVYRRLEADPADRLPSVCEAYENGVALDVLSKHAGLAGLRIGWLATRRADLLDAVAVVKDYNSICASGPSEILAEVAVRHLDRLVDRNVALLRSNRALLDRFFAARPGFARWSPPRGGSIAFPRLADGADAGTLAERLVAEAGVLVLPGACYGFDASCFRIGFGRANLPEALGRLEAWLDR